MTTPAAGPGLPEGWVVVTDALYDTESGDYMLFGKGGAMERPYPGWGRDLHMGWVLARNAARTTADFWQRPVCKEVARNG